MAVVTAAGFAAFVFARLPCRLASRSSPLFAQRSDSQPSASLELGSDPVHGSTPSISPPTPTRWAPVFAGLGCPLALLLQIPHLTQSWAGSSLHLRAPLLVGLALSLFLGLAANVSLLCRYFEHRPQLSTVAAIGLLTTHDLLNLALIVVLALHEPVFAHNSWTLLLSTGLSSSCNVALVVDYYMVVDNFRAQGSGLTMKQRTLIIVTMLLLLYVGLGALVFTFLEKDQVTYSDALYFCVCTVTTVGFGDITPTTPASRAFVFFFAIAGIVLLATTVSTTHDTLHEALDAFSDIECFKKARGLRHVRAWSRGVGECFHSKKTLDPRLPNVETTVLPGSPCPSMAATSATSLTAPWSTWLKRLLGFLGVRRQAVRTCARAGVLAQDPARCYEQFKNRLVKQDQRQLRRKLALAVALFACFWLLGGVVFMFTEGWTYGTSLYFGYVAFLTLGFGDLTVHSSGGRTFFIIWFLVGIGNMTLLLSVLTDAWTSKYKRAVVRHQENMKDLDKVLTMFGLKISDGVASQANVQRTFLPQGRMSHDSVQLEDIPRLLVEAANGFSNHARYWMGGLTGEPPEGLLEMMAATENLEGVDRFRATGGLIEQVSSPDIRKKLFLISFAKAFEHLTERVAQSEQIVREHSDELKRLRIRNDQCACEFRSNDDS